MATDRRTYADPCGISRALDVFGERWALLVVRELMFGPRRFGQLRAGLPDASPNVISQRLKELAEDGIVRRFVLEPPASVAVYELTERGRALEPILVELGRWGSATPRLAGREMSSSSMLFALKTMFMPHGDARVVYGLVVDGEHFRVAVTGPSIEITRSRAEDAVSVLTTDVTSLRMLVFLGTGVRALEDAGALTVSGDRRAATRFPKFFAEPRPIT